MQVKAEARNTGIGFSGLLAIVLITLKLCGVIDWSWWWVTAPVWIPMALFVLIMIVGVFVIAIHETVADYKRTKRK